MPENKDIIVFGDKTLADLMKEAHTAHKKREKQLDELIDQLRGYVKNIGDGVMLSQHIQGYEDLQIKNDDVKMKMIMTIVKANQRAKDEGKDAGSMILTEEEKAQLRQLNDSLTTDLDFSPPKQLTR